MELTPALIRQRFAQGRTSFRPEEILAYGLERFMAEVSARGPFPIPDLHFTAEENRLMDEILAEERRVKNNAA